MTKIFLDSASMHPVLLCALEAYQTAPFGNPSSEHAAGQNARTALEQAREKIARLMDCETTGNVYFTSTATEAAALAIRSLEAAGYDVITSPYEHHAVSENADGMHRAKSAYARMLANNETGELFPFLDCNFPYVCDATAAVGHIPVSFKNIGCDYLIADGIKFGGVPGAAFLIAKKDVPLFPLIRGGGQERGMRSGTENVPAICAMAAALEWQTQHMEENTDKLLYLREIMLSAVMKIPNAKLNLPEGSSSLPHILNVSFADVNAHALVLLLSKAGVMISAGAACSNGLNEPSHVIMAMYNDEQRAREAVRISFSCVNTKEEVITAAREIKSAVEFLRSIA